jgi:GT2 family glycosyltransferase
MEKHLEWRLGERKVQRTLRGWRNPLPISISIPQDSLVPLRESIRRDIDALAPRCEALERSLSASMLNHPSYAASKLRHQFSLDLGRDAVALRDPIARLPNPTPRIHRTAVADANTPIGESVLLRVTHIIAVGVIVDQSLRELLSGRHIEVLVPGDGATVLMPSGNRRPATDSFGAWLSRHDDAERAAFGAIVLGRTAGRADVDLLRHRLHGHQRVLAEVGSGALSWLLALWDGSVARYGDVFVFAEPGSLFREPSTRARFSHEVDWPRISVVTVSYNQHEFLEQCLFSVFNQRYPNLEYIVVDAGSTDGSIEILRRHEARFDHLIIEPDEGQSDGLNKGFRQATGDILTWTNSDDMLAPWALKRAALAFAESGADLVTGTCARVEGVDAQLIARHYSALPTGQRVSLDLCGALDWQNGWEKGDYFFQPEVLFTRDIWERSGGYLKPHLYWAMDWDLWLRCALVGATVIRIPDLLGISRVHTAQKTTSEESYLWQIRTILRDYDDLLALLQRDAIMPLPLM